MIDARPVAGLAGTVRARSRLVLAFVLGLSSLLFFNGAVHAQQALDFAKTFNPATIGPGSTSSLEFSITNNNAATGVRGLNFTDNLPTGVSIATPASAASTCLGTVSAPDGGSTISFSDGEVGASQTCTVSVNVTSSTAGTHTNVSGALDSDAGTFGTATADLTVATDRPGFSKSFAPSPIPPGGTSTLTLIIDNSANAAAVFGISFIDNLPTGMVIATPANATTDCSGAALTAIPGTGVISLFGSSSLAAGATCTVSVDVTTATTGVFVNTTGELASGINPNVSSGFATAALNVPRNTLVKSFTDDPVLPGGTVNLEFTVTNFNRTEAATSITFDDNLTAVVTGLAPSGALPTDPCGAGSTLTFTDDILSLTGGTLPAEGFCSFSVNLDVPAATAPGTYPNTTTAIMLDVAGDTVTGNVADDLLFVVNFPVLTKEFTDDPVAAGDNVTLEFTITNTDTAAAATSIGFEDVFDIILPTGSSIPAAGFCGPGATATFTPLTNPPPPSSATPAKLVVSGASLDPGASCTFDVTLGVAAGAAAGTYPNTTSPITATVGGNPVVGDAASDDLVVAGAPELIKTFIDDPAQPGDNATLEFTIVHDESASANATDIAFDDNLTAALAGLTAIGLPTTAVCGAGSEIVGTTFLSFTGGSLAPGESCTVAVTVAVPSDALPGNHLNTTSNITATVGGLATTGAVATDALHVAGLTLEKEFTDDPVIPGGTVNLRFTLANTSAGLNATSIGFTDDLNDVLTNLAPTTLPSTASCGAGSSLSFGSGVLTFADGNLAAGTSCAFDVPLLVPATTPENSYFNVTSGLSADMDGESLLLDPAQDELLVSAVQLLISKAFQLDTVVPGGSVDLKFTVTNLSATETITGIEFSDNLDDALAGLLVTSTLPASACGGTLATADGGMSIDLTGGELAPGASCDFTVTVTVPTSAVPGGTVNNTTSEVTGDVGTLDVRGDPASDSFNVGSAEVTFTKAFAGPVEPGDSTTLTFNLSNADTQGIAQLAFTDNLDAVVLGMVADGLPQNDVCGPGSKVEGTSVIALTGGNLAGNDSCSFGVTVQVPTTAAPGSFLNTTSDLFSQGLVVSPPATATLTVNEPTGNVTICHRPGTPAEKTLVLPPSAIPGHLGHGDTLGPCPENPEPTNGGGPKSKTEKAPSGAVWGDSRILRLPGGL